MELEMFDLILLLAGFLAGVVTFEFCWRAYERYSDRRDIREAKKVREARTARAAEKARKRGYK